MLEIKQGGYVEYDIALLELATPVNFARYPHIRPACLPAAADQLYPRNSVGIVVGWGYTEIERYSDNGKGHPVRNSQSDVLNKLDDVKIINRDDCNDFFRESIKQIRIPEGSVCGVSPTGDACQGDSGNGLVYRNKTTGKYELSGIVSYGIGCNSTTGGESI